MDELAGTIFHSRVEHIPVEEICEEAQAVGHVVVELVDFLEANIEDPNDEMVVR